jgi:hypothetical protein
MNNRQAGRRRGRGGQRPGNAPGRSDNGNRIDNRSRGNAAQLLEKYKNLAADAQRAGDRVNTEYYLQFADHYFRVLSESRSRFEENRRQRDDADEEGDDEFGYEGEPGTQSAVNGNGRDDRYEERANGRDERGDRNFRRERNDGPRRDERPRYANDEGDAGDPREERPRREARAERDERPQPANDAADEVAPRRRGRPRRDAAPAPSGASESFDAAVLPPAIGVDTAADAGVEGEERPRRRRLRAPKEAPPPAA